MQITLYFALNQTGCGIKRSRKNNTELKEPTHTNKHAVSASRASQLDSLNKLFECRHAQTDLFAPCPKNGFLYSPWNWKVFTLSNYYEWETWDSQKRINRVKTQGENHKWRSKDKEWEIREGFAQCQMWVRHDHDLPILQMLSSLKHILTILEGVYQ